MAEDNVRQIFSIIPPNMAGTTNIIEEYATPQLRYFTDLEGKRELQQLWITRFNDNVGNQWRPVPSEVQQPEEEAFPNAEGQQIQEPDLSVE